MRTNFLFPNCFRPVGWILLIPAAIVGYMSVFMGFECSVLDLNVLSLLHALPSGPISGWKVVENNFTQELAGILFIVGALMVAFSKEKIEDEYIAKIRLESLLWATYATFAIQVFCLLFFYDFTFLYAMIVNMFTLLIVFIIRYSFLIYRAKARSDEK